MVLGIDARGVLLLGYIPNPFIISSSIISISISIIIIITRD